MKILYTFLLVIVAASLVIGLGYFLLKDKMAPATQKIETDKKDDFSKLVDFSKISKDFLFSAKVPVEFEAEYIPTLRAINIYDPMLRADSDLEKSQIYISFFKANKFLTLNTVNITKEEKMTIQGREAILYEITKKSFVPDFSGQPSWRNFTHYALDVRLSRDSPSYFYSFAYNPALPEKTFNDMVDSLFFHPTE